MDAAHAATLQQLWHSRAKELIEDVLRSVFARAHCAYLRARCISCRCGGKISANWRGIENGRSFVEILRVRRRASNCRRGRLA